jgi:hypothetical protein
MPTIRFNTTACSKYRSRRRLHHTPCSIAGHITIRKLDLVGWLGSGTSKMAILTWHSHLVSNPRALETTSTPTLFGICTGSITAAAVASCQNLTEVLNIAPQAITLLFHVGLEASKRSQALERSKRSWTTTVGNLTEETAREIIETFNKTNVSVLEAQHHKASY